jgi:hypothetical protein
MKVALPLAKYSEDRNCGQRGSWSAFVAEATCGNVRLTCWRAD